MSIVWQKESASGSCQVRKAGNSVRLYTNGVFHSQFNPANPVRGSLWELLIIPALFRMPGVVQRVLVLGVGGGTVIRLLNLFVKPQEIVGVELNPLHIQVARRFFGVDKMQAEIIQGDATAWVRGYRGASFDLIIDDLYGEECGVPRRAVTASKAWFQQLSSHLSLNGILVMNFISHEEMTSSAYFEDSATKATFVSAFQLSMPQYENSIAAFFCQKASIRQLRSNLTRITALNPRRKSTKLQYRVRGI